jgi:hypothetical protein
VAISPVPVWIFSAVFCVTWYQLLKPKSGFWFECCGHDGLLMGFVFSLCLVLAFLSPIALPFSFLWDWRKWKKNSLRK